MRITITQMENGYTTQLTEDLPPAKEGVRPMERKQKLIHANKIDVFSYLNRQLGGPDIGFDVEGID